MLVFFFKQKTAYEMRISDWSSDVCSSDLARRFRVAAPDSGQPVLALHATLSVRRPRDARRRDQAGQGADPALVDVEAGSDAAAVVLVSRRQMARGARSRAGHRENGALPPCEWERRAVAGGTVCRSEEHTSELQS